MKLDVQVGDTILYSTNYGRLGHLAKVERLTKTQAICEGDVRVMLATSNRVGATSSCDRCWCRKATPEDIARVTLEKRIRKAASTLSVFKVAAHNIDAVEALLEAELANQPE